MSKVVLVKSPAKLNLHLDVQDKRSDGYHNITSIFQMIDFFDELSVRSLKEKEICSIEGDFECVPSRNTIWSAVHVFREETGIDQGVSVSVRKRIPTGGGTGGGSSNAASTLFALDALFHTALGKEKLAELAAKIGSDVPFFCGTPAALVMGRGEIIRAIDRPCSHSFLLLYPDFGISTPSAYAWLDTDREQLGLGSDTECSFSTDELIGMYVDGRPRSWRFFNSFFPVVCRRYPILSVLQKELYARGALFAQMSGSGSAIFGIFDSEIAARRAGEGIIGNFRKIALGKLLDRLPNTVLQ